MDKNIDPHLSVCLCHSPSCPSSLWGRISRYFAEPPQWSSPAFAEILLTPGAFAVILSFWGTLKSDSAPSCSLLRSGWQTGPSCCLCPFAKCQVSETRYSLHQERALDTAPAQGDMTVLSALDLCLEVPCLQGQSWLIHTHDRLDYVVRTGVSNLMKTLY